MSGQAALEPVLRAAPVIPVVTIDNAARAVPLARALVQGGLPVIEITLRTPAGLGAIRAIAAEVPEAIPGAGTVLTLQQMDDVARAGARFIVSPGVTARMLDAAAEREVGFLPGIATASEAMMLIERGLRFAKFFPAEPAGGAEYLAALASPLPQLRFCPTGGITPDSAPRYLRLPNVVCVGGSWMVKRKSIEAGEWSAIREGAAQAAALDAHRRRDEE